MSKPQQVAQSEWAKLEQHFGHHALRIARFRNAGPTAVLSMLRSGRNERGNLLSTFEREALVERHCEIFGTWPT
jgi:hypothetical protein